MNKNLSHYFSAGRFSRWPIWKVGVSALLAVVFTATILTTSTTAAVQALVPKPTPVPTPVATPEPIVMQKHLDTGWLKINWTDSGIEPAQKEEAYRMTADLSTRQQDLYIEVCATNSVTGKTTALKEVPVQVVLTCAELTKIEDESHKHDNPASELNATTTFDVDPKTGKLKIEKLNPGKYGVTLQTTEKQYKPSKIQYITIKEQVEYKKVEATAKPETPADAQEDQKPQHVQDSGDKGEEVVVEPIKNGWAYPLSAAKTWNMPGGDALYLYAADGTTRTPYRVEVRNMIGVNGKPVKVLYKADFDQNADKYLMKQAAAPAALTVGGLRTAAVQDPAPNDVPSEEESPQTPPNQPDTEPSEKPDTEPSEKPDTKPSDKPTEAPPATPVPTASFALFDAEGAKIEGLPFLLPALVEVLLDSDSPDSGKVMGIDVSKYQPNINWKEVKQAGIDFVIIRMGYRGYGSGKIVEDPYFRKHLQGAKAAGLKVGIYFFSQAIDEKEAVEEASVCLNAVAGQRLDYPIFFDSEYSTSSKTGRADGLSKGERTSCAVAFCETIRNAGYTAGVYASTSWFRHQLNYSDLTKYRIWNAHYGVSASPINCHIWQYTGNGRVAGVYNSKGELTPVDVNYSYMG